jgi:hypothetical protein
MCESTPPRGRWLCITLGVREIDPHVEILVNVFNACA